LLSQVTGRGTTAEELQIASNRTPGESPVQTAERLQLSPQATLSALLSSGLTGYNLSQQAPEFMQDPTVTGGLATAGSGLKLAGSLGTLAGLDPTAMSALQLAGSGAGLASKVPNVVGSFTSPAWPGIGGQSPQFGAQLGGATGLAGGALGMGGTIAGMAGAPAPVTAGLNLGGAALSLGSALSGTSGAAAAGALGGGAAGAGASMAALGVVAPMFAAAMAIRAWGQARDAAKNKQDAERAQSEIIKLQQMMPALGQATQRFQAGQSTPQDYNTMLTGIRHIWDSNVGVKGLKLPDLAPLHNQLFGALQQNPELYKQAFTDLQQGRSTGMPGSWSPYAQISGTLGRGKFGAPPPPSQADIPAFNAWQQWRQGADRFNQREAYNSPNPALYAQPAPDPWARYRTGVPSVLNVMGQHPQTIQMQGGYVPWTRQLEGPGRMGSETTYIPYTDVAALQRAFGQYAFGPQQPQTPLPAMPPIGQPLAPGSLPPGVRLPSAV
jgi:hypothetical protein